MEVLSNIQNLLTEQKKLREERKETGTKVENLKKSGFLNPEQSDMAVWANFGLLIFRQSEVGKHINELTDRIFETLQKSVFGDQKEEEEEQESKPQKAEVKSKQGDFSATAAGPKKKQRTTTAAKNIKEA